MFIMRLFIEKWARSDFEMKIEFFEKIFFKKKINKFHLAYEIPFLHELI